MTATATDAVTDGRLIELPPEAGDVDAPVFEPNDAWLQRASPDEQKAAMWRWFATRYEDPAQPETAAPQDAGGDRVFDADDADCRADLVLHERFDAFVPSDVVDELVRRVQQQVGNLWARRGIDKMGS